MPELMTILLACLEFLGFGNVTGIGSFAIVCLLYTLATEGYLGDFLQGMPSPVRA